MTPAWVFRAFELGVLLSFLGAYFSVSAIGLGTGLVLVFGTCLVLTGRLRAVFPANPLFLPVALLAAAIALSVVLAKPYPFEKPIGKLRYFLCFFYFAWYFTERPRALERVLGMGWWIAVLLGVLALFQVAGFFTPSRLFGGPPLAPLPQGNGHVFLAKGFAFHHSPFAATMLMLHLVFLAHWALSRDPARLRKYGVPAVFSAVAVLCSFSRGAWLAWLAASLAVCGLLSRRYLGRALVSLGGLLLALFALSPAFRRRLLDIRPSMNSERLELWRICLEMFKDAPVFGQGFYSFGSRYTRYTDWHLRKEHFPVEAHNMYLDLLSGTGLVGIAAFAFFLGAALSLALKLFRALPEGHGERPWALASFGLIVAFMVAGLFDKQLYMTQTLVPNLFFLSLCASLAMRHGLVSSPVAAGRSPAPVPCERT